MAGEIKDLKKEFIKKLDELVHYSDGKRRLEVWQDFVTMFACAISNSVDKKHWGEREKLYLKTVKKYPKKCHNMFSELAAYTIMALDRDQEQDFLGSIYMNLDLGNSNIGQFFTPYHICQLMAKITLSNAVEVAKRDGYISINDPCCGGGGLLIAGINEVKKELKKAGLNHQKYLWVVAQDIDFTVALMCYIQLSLLGVAGFVKIGNALTDPVRENDSQENYWVMPVTYFPTGRRIEYLKRRNKNDI